MGKNIVIIVLLILAFSAFGFGLYENQQAQQYKAQSDQATQDKQALLDQQKQADEAKAAEAQKAKEQSLTVNVDMAEENRSGESGTATLKEENGKVTVTIALTGFLKDIVQPAHIHAGVCPGVGKVLYPLSDVINGTSTTTLNVTLDQLKSQFPLAVNVHKSKTAIGTYTACGLIGGSASVSVSPTRIPTQSPSATGSSVFTPTVTR